MEKFYTAVQGTLIGTATAIAAYFDSTFSFLCALILSFLFNILAGFKADEVKIHIKRIFPPDLFDNFNGNKLKDSLMELFLIVSITYILKGFADLMRYEGGSYYVVQFLVTIAIYYYFRNGLKNLVSVYPKVKFIRLVYYLIAFKLKEIIGIDLSKIVDKAEKENEKTRNNH